MGSYSKFFTVTFLILTSGLYAGEEPFPQITEQDKTQIGKELIQEIKKLKEAGSVDFILKEEDIKKASKLICKDKETHKSCYANTVHHLLKLTINELVDTLYGEVFIYAVAARATTTLKELEGSEVALRYYEKKRGITIDPNLKTVLLKEDLGEDADRFQSGTAGAAIGHFEKEKHFEVTATHKDNKTGEEKSVTTRVTVKGYSPLANWLVKRLFNVERFIALFHVFHTRSREMRLVMLVHELRHIVDMAAGFPDTYNYWDHRKKMAQKLEKENLIEKDYQEVIKTKEYQEVFQQILKQAKKESGLDELLPDDDNDPKSLREAAETKIKELVTQAYKDEFATAMTNKFLYLYDPVEKRGFLEEMRFFTDKEYGLGLGWDQILVFYKDLGSSQQPQQKASVVPESPDLSLEKRYLRELYDEVWDFGE